MLAMCRSAMLEPASSAFPASGKDHPLSAADERPRRAAPGGQGGGERRRLPSARRAARSADRAVQPRKHVPATVEFADMAAPPAARSGAAALLDVAAFRNADALLHVVRMFRDPAVPHPAGSVDPARDVRTMEDELILADLGVVERRLERLERDLKKGARARELQKEQDVLERCRAALEDGRPLRALELSPDEDASGCADFSSSRPSRCCSCSISTRRIWRRRTDAVALAGLRARSSRAREHARGADLREDRAGDRAARRGRRARRSWRISACSESGLDRVIRASYDLLGYISFFTVGEDESRAWSIPRGTARPGGGRRDPHRHPARLHPRRGRAATSTCSRAGASRRAAITASCGWRARSTSSSTATSSTSATPRDDQSPIHRCRPQGTPPLDRDDCPHGGRLRGAGAVRARRCGGARPGARARAARARLRGGAGRHPVQVVSEGRDPAARGRVAAASISPRATAGRSTW